MSANKRISETGLNAMKDNGIEMVDLLTFTEGDIGDLFKTFSDRRCVRKYIEEASKESAPFTLPGLDKSAISSAFPLETDDIATASCSSPDHEDSDHNSTPIAGQQNNTYSIDELLEKKSVRGKSTKGQKYFSTLLKDSATASRIWKNALPLHEIPGRKREIFHNKMEEQFPGFKDKRSLIWRRLGEHLQNRRKYLNDKETGKRTTKQIPKLKTINTVQQSVNAPDSTALTPCPGDAVYILDKINNRVAMGIYICAESDIYAKVVLKTKVASDKDRRNMELPVAQSTGATNLCDVGAKEVITYWTKRLQINKKGKETKSNENSQRKSDVSMPGPARKIDMRNQTKLNNNSKQKSDVPIPAKVTKIDIKRNETKSNNNSKRKSDVPMSAPSKATKIDIEGNETKSNNSTQKSDVPIPASVFAKKETPHFHTFVLMEWGHGQLYWGVKLVSVTGVVIRNAVKACARIEPGKIFDVFHCKELHKNTLNIKLSTSDVQINPDMIYCVWELPKDESNKIISLKSGGKFGTFEISCDELSFITALSEKMQKYQCH